MSIWSLVDVLMHYDTSPVARGLKIKSFWIHLSSSNFLCVTQTKSLRPSEIKLDGFFLRHTLKPFWWTFFHPIFSPFMWIALEKNFRLFQASGIFHVLPKITLLIFQKKSIVGLHPSKPLNCDGELYRFLYLKVWFFYFSILIEMLREKISYSNSIYILIKSAFRITFWLQEVP